MLSKVRRWGNSLAVRLPKVVVDRLGIAEGDVVEVKLSKASRLRGGLDLTALPIFYGEDPQVSVEHDRYLYGEPDADR